MARPKIRKIALLMSQDLGYCRNVLAGILSYRAPHQLWIHRDSPPDTRIMPALRKWEPDGIIAHIYHPKVSKALESFSCPIINTTNTLEDYDLPRVDVSNLETGQMAAEYLMDKGVGNFAYFGSSTAVFSRQREKGFTETLEKHGHEVSSCYAAFLPRPPFRSTWDERDKRVIKWLQELPKPCGILASNDIPARYLAEICTELDINIPNELAILGVDNDEAECRMSTPPLSSIETPAKAIGYRAAEMLDYFLRGKTIPEPIVRMSPLRVITRESTDIESHPDAIIQQLMTIIKETATNDPSVEEIAQRCNLSRRVLEKKVSTILGSTVLGLIQKQQLKTAKNLLLDSYLPINVIAEMCGLDNQRRFNDVFKKKTGLTPSKFRAQHLIQKS